jgi:hypothetical protein
MVDVFISYSTRGASEAKKQDYEKWIAHFRNSVKEAYLSNYAQELEVWDAINKNVPGVNFEEEINRALQQSLILIMVLDPAYLGSPQTIAEIEQYKKIKETHNEPLWIIKVVKKRGDKDNDIKAIVSSNIILSYFSQINADNNEAEYEETGEDYANEIFKIVKVIKRFKVEHARKVNSQKILTRLTELEQVPKVYVALGHSKLEESRSKFINQLNETIKRTNGLRDVKVLPDDFTFTLFNHEALGELLCEENLYRKECLDAMLGASCAIIVPFESNTSNEAEVFLKKIQFQLNAIKRKAQEERIPVHLLLNIPEVLFKTPAFMDELDNPAYSGYKNIKIVKELNITSFIDSFISGSPFLHQPVAPDTQPAEETEKNIYIIEYNNSASAATQPSEELLKVEYENRLELRAYIINRQFALIPNLDAATELSQAIELHKEWLKISDGIIIYRGIREDELWCRQQQSETFKAILDLKREKIKEDLERAVFVDKLQPKRHLGEYAFFKYDVILDHPLELERFLCKVRRH